MYEECLKVSIAIAAVFLSLYAEYSVFGLGDWATSAVVFCVSYIIINLVFLDVESEKR